MPMSLKICSYCTYVTLGVLVKVNGQESFVMRMSLGMILEVSRINLAILLKMMVTGGWPTQTGKFTIIKFMSARSFQTIGASSRFKENGRVLPMEVLIQQP